MTYLLDTDTCVFALRGSESVCDRLHAVESEAVAISVITLAELRYGAACSAKSEANHQAVDDFDLLIAATAQRHRLTLITHNLEHFTRLPELRLADWVHP